jgi:hypothetical protein
MRDLTHLQSAPAPPAERIEHAARILANLGQIEELNGWDATFRLENCELTGVWPALADVDLTDFEAPVDHLHLDHVDPESSWQRQLQRSRLAIRQGMERANLERRLMREALEEAREAG